MNRRCFQTSVQDRFADFSSRLPISIVLGLIYLNLNCLAGSPESPLSISNLRCEYRSNPAGLDMLHPRLSWICASDQRGQRQTAYQILAASSLEALSANTPELWDSGKIQSDQNSQVVYEGK